MIEWPTTLPLPHTDYSAAPRNTTITSEGESGHTQRRSRSAKSYVQTQVYWMLTITQHSAFATFFADTLFNGAAQFEIELKYPRNTTLESWVVRFLGGYQAEYLDGIWAVGASLDLVRRTTLAAIAPALAWEAFLVVDDASGATEPEPFLVDGQPFYVRIP